MKKILTVMLAVLLCLSVLSGCSDDHTAKRNVVELTNANLWQYLTVTEITSFVPAESDASLECVVDGVLDYAFYEDVVLTFEVTHFTPGSVVSDRENKIVTVLLNAAGEADFVVEYSGLARAINETGRVTSEAIGELYWFNRSIRLKSVSGKVIYTI